MSKVDFEERCRQLYVMFSTEFADASLAIMALTHKSFGNEHRDEKLLHNERLEFLGDAVVDLAISHRLMERFPLSSEGELSKLRALIVNEEGLARVARKIGLGPLLLLGRGEELSGGRDKNSVLADALEAVLGAVYLASGMQHTLSVVDRVFEGVLEGVATGGSGADYKTRLQELAQQRHKATPRYRVVTESGPEHAKQFEIEVTVGDLAMRAVGRSKKEAEQLAAQKLLENLQTPSKDLGEDLPPE